MMKRIQFLSISCLLLLTPMLAFAQEQSDQQPQVEEINLVKPANDPPFSLAGRLYVNPVCHDEQDFCLALQPGFTVNTKLGMANDRMVDLMFDYRLKFQRYITEDNHNSNDMDFRNYIVLNGNVGVTDRWDVNFFGLSEIFFRANGSGDDEVFILANPEIGFKIFPTTRFALGYLFRYVIFPSVVLGPGEILDGPPGGEDDIGEERILTVSTFPQFDPFGNFLGISNTGSNFENERFMTASGLQAVLTHKFTPTTKGKFAYRYGEWDANAVYLVNTENWFRLQIDHGWKNRFGTTSVGTQYRLRIRNFFMQLADDGISDKTNYRHRLYAVFSHSFTKNFSLDFEYRLERRESNAVSAEYTKNRVYFGPTVKF